jgi:hypothetical protein
VHYWQYFSFAEATEYYTEALSSAEVSVLSKKRETSARSSVTRYFARQLLNKHAKNYQNVEKITKHLSKTKSVKHFPSLKLCFFHVFLSHLYFLIVIVQNANMAPE